MKRSKIFSGVVAALLILISSCKPKEGFEMIDAQSAGIDFENLLDQKEDLTILDYLYYYNGGGVAVGDVNGDGLADVFLSANQGENKLYLNKGDWKFENVTEKSGITKKSSWNTGAVMADVNGDGHLDIYVCAVVGINGFYGFNELYINNGSGQFSEQAAEYGLDLDTYSTAASFFDYDLDGDLDVYILNHAIHTDRSFGNADLRNSRNYATGDRLLKNENGKFIDVSEEAGIFGGINGYGLGLSTADFNDDGYPDIYVGNDFHEDDYFYINNGDGTFSERLKEFFTYSTRFSMGNDIADLNGDGKLDLISLDMLPEDEFNLKSSEGDDNIQTQKMRVEDFGYHYQFTRNMLFLSEADNSYRETALLSGVAATDWSWSALFTDIDLDSKQDLFISNGIPKRPNNLDFIRFLSNEQVQQKINNTSLVDTDALEMMPGGTVATKVFKGEKGPSFTDVSSKWIKNDISNTSATAYADFDLDGDLDFISNAIDGSPKLYKNIQETANNYLSIKLSYPGKNRLAIGAKVMLYNKGSVQTKYLNNLKGFQASSEPIIHFGLGAQSQVDSIVVRWPNKTYTQELNLQGNRHLTLDYKAEEVYTPELNKKNYALSFEKIDPNAIGLDYRHIEDNYLDFNREKLMPYRLSDRGPAALYTDLNNDGQKDLFIGGAKFESNTIFIFKDSLFTNQSTEERFLPLTENKLKEIVVASSFTDETEQKKLILGAAGADFFGKASALKDDLFTLSDAGVLQEINSGLEQFFLNTKVVEPIDFDNDGDTDLFVGNQHNTGQFGLAPQSYILENKEGAFHPLPITIKGAVTDAIWHDVNEDEKLDLLVVGEFMKPAWYLQGENKNFIRKETQAPSGLYQMVDTYDIDKDGDLDFILGNWGLNSKFKASNEHPLRVYTSDFDGNGQTEPIVAVYKENAYYPLSSTDDLSKQMVSLRKSFSSYNEFAGKSIVEIFSEDQLKAASLYEAEFLGSGFLRNENGVSNQPFIPFENELQTSPISSSLKIEIPSGEQSLLLGGNYLGVKPYHGKYDTFSGALINKENDVILGSELGLDFKGKALRALIQLQIENTDYLLAIFNNEALQLYKINTK